jgi:hypothetical protein
MMKTVGHSRPANGHHRHKTGHDRRVGSCNGQACGGGALRSRTQSPPGSTRASVT